MCCNGVIFADVLLQRGDSPEQLQALGLPLATAGGENQAGATSKRTKFCQPCAAFDGSRCRIYHERPVYCRKFECLLMKKFHQGRITGDAALGKIRLAKDRSHRVVELIRALGDTDEQLPLARRFQRTRERLEAIGMDRPLAELYGDLTVAVLDLNALLSEAFYPG